jgi:glutamine phosphoribosylpyrophosphate amidotransferase
MCVIAICQENYLDENEIKKMWNANNHGAGVVWWNYGVKMKKGFMKLKELLSFYSSIKFYAHIIHFRSATSGGVLASLTHPFQVKTSKGSGYLFHNGIWNDYESFKTYLKLKGLIKENEIVSDTLVLSKVLTELYDIEKICRFLEKLNWGKFILALNDEYIKIGDFQKLKDGVEVSNNSWCYYQSVGFTKSYCEYYGRDCDYYIKKWMI